MNKLKHMKKCIFHPFDGFYEAKYRGMGSSIIALCVFALYGLVKCVEYQYTGFVMNLNHITKMNSVTVFISSITVYLLFALSNWTVTTLFDGKGKLKDIILVTAYSLVPVVIINAIVIFLSNFVISEETVILSAFMGFGWVWFAFMMVSGLCTIHEYGLGKNIVTLLATLAAAVIVMFLLILFISLIEQMVSFVITFAKEFARRI